MSEYSLGDALKNYINTQSNHKLRNGLRSAQIEDVWETTMGKTIAKYTEKIELVNKTLFITTSIAALKQELSYQKKAIIEIINEDMGPNTVENVVIR